MLFLVATPIGNLQDISFRALEILKSCDYILCEDTRHSKKLLNHFDIHKPLKSFHKFNETEMEETVLHDLREGYSIALISDAGTPAISDPGEQLVKRCHDEKLQVSAIPGPCAFVQALVSSGLPTNQFQFLGFLPKKKSELAKTFADALHYPGSNIFYESPNRLKATLKALKELSPTCQVAVARELTKKFEQVNRGTPQELLELYADGEVKGEIVLIVKGEVKEADFSHLSPKEHVEWVQKEYGLSQKEAIKFVAKSRGVHKSAIYSLFIPKIV